MQASQAESLSKLVNTKSKDNQNFNEEDEMRQNLMDTGVWVQQETYNNESSQARKNTITAHNKVLKLGQDSVARMSGMSTLPTT